MSAIRQHPSLVVMFGLALVFVFIVPEVTELYIINDMTVFAVMATLALSLALVWGFGGILSLGQSVFFGIGGYVYAITVLNTGESTIPILLGVVVPMAFASLLGYFMFYGRISDIYLAVITLTVSLIFYHLIVGTSGGQWRIGQAPIGGYNGIPGLPPINLPGDADARLGFEGKYYLSVIVMFLTYFGIRWLLGTRFGRVAISIRENEARTELIGYDARAYKLVLYTVGAGIAGLAGVLYANWGGFVSPVVFNIFFTAQIIVWVMVGGLGTLVGPMLAAIAIQYLVTQLGAAATSEIKAGLTIFGLRLELKDFLDSNIVLGMIFIVFTLFIPKGIVPFVRDSFQERRAHQQRAAESGSPAE